MCWHCSIIVPRVDGGRSAQISIDSDQRDARCGARDVVWRQTCEAQSISRCAASAACEHRTLLVIGRHAFHALQQRARDNSLTGIYPGTFHDYGQRTAATLYRVCSFRSDAARRCCRRANRQSTAASANLVETIHAFMAVSFLRTCLRVLACSFSFRFECVSCACRLLGDISSMTIILSIFWIITQDAICTSTQKAAMSEALFAASLTASALNSLIVHSSFPGTEIYMSMSYSLCSLHTLPS